MVCAPLNLVGPRKIPAKLPPTFHCKISKKITDELLQERQEKKVMKAMHACEGQAASRVYQKHARAFLHTLAKPGDVCRTLVNPQRHIHENLPGSHSETGRIRFRGVRFQTPNSVSFSGLTEFWGENSVSSSQPIICVPKRTHRVFRGTHRVCCRTQ